MTIRTYDGPPLNFDSDRRDDNPNTGMMTIRRNGQLVSFPTPPPIRRRSYRSFL